jgi:hypothetical protein|tara:strand:- start:3221 stop:3766 length:546 start_codon:yes stop_codon:yes gene_type:complete
MSLVNLDNQAISLKSLEFEDGTFELPPEVYKFLIPNVLDIPEEGSSNPGTLIYTSPKSFPQGVYLIEHNLAIGAGTDGIIEFDVGTDDPTNMDTVGRYSGNVSGTGGNPATSGNPTNGGITLAFKNPHVSVWVQNNVADTPFGLLSHVVDVNNAAALYQVGGIINGIDYTGLMSVTVTRIN